MIDQSYSLYGNESKRLAALSSFNILDTLPEKEYDAIVRLASYICRTPIAFISFVDTERLWYKSIVGLAATEGAKGRFSLYIDYPPRRHFGDQQHAGG